MTKRTLSFSLLAVVLGLAVAILARFCELHPDEAPVALAIAGFGAFALAVCLIAVALASAQNWGRERE